MAAFTGSADHPNPEAAVWLEGSHFEAGKLARENFVLDMRQKVTALAVPYVLIQGREDHVTPTAPAKAYYDQLRAPAKAFVEIGGGHFACFTDTEEFLAALRMHVPPGVNSSF